MRSRAHAIATSMIAALLPFLSWFSTVVVALVCLRHGIAAGATVLIWTVLPIGVGLYFSGDPTPGLWLLGTFLLAILLRQTMSLELVLVAAVVLAALSTLIFELTASGALERLAEFYVEYLNQIDGSLVITMEEARTLLLGFFGLGQGFLMLVLLIIARWCQSALYNPGGFSKEFHQLRLSPGISVALIAGMGVCYTFSEQLGQWMPLLTVPLIMAALGLAHWFVASRELSSRWLVGLYAGLVLLSQLVYPFLASLALMDSWFNIRNRLKMIEKD